MHKSWSMSFCAAIPPACARVVPTALNTISGLGWSVEILEPQVDESASWRASSLGEVSWGSRREMVLMELKVSLARSVLRMTPPTAPVLPKSAAVVIMLLFFFRTRRAVDGVKECVCVRKPPEKVNDVCVDIDPSILRSHLVICTVHCTNY